MKGEAVLTLCGFSKQYNRLWRKGEFAVRDLSFSINRGSIVGLLGPNGAGKSTTINCVLGLLRPSAGSISILGRAPGDPDLLGRIGVVSEIHPNRRDLPARNQLRFFGKLSGLSGRELDERIDTLAEKFGILSDLGRDVSEFSKGMGQRLGFVQALLNDPEILILDEPTTGLDPEGRRLVGDTVLEQKSMGKTILFSTHILSDVEKLCDEALILYRGRLKEHLLLGSTTESWTVTVSGKDEDMQSFPWEKFLGQSGSSKERREDGESISGLPESTKDALLAEVVARGLKVERVSRGKNIEQSYFHHTREGEV